ncbi:MAG: COQ9 family protein [Alphaproteobacteria bacterium]|nr:COQ9 family protein [Alphaproteobacteria bacterium]
MPTPSTNLPVYNKVINCTLKHVPVEGWTLNALNLGAIEAEVNNQDVLVFFNHNMDNVISYYSEMLDLQMTQMLESYNLETRKIRERIALAVMTRLELMAPHREAAKRTASYLAFPTKLPFALRLLYKTVNTMWYCAGDTATDFNFYTKRGLLTGVYSSAFIYWLNDQSAGFADTRAFVERRISNVMVIPKMKGRIQEFCKIFRKPFGF